MKETNIFSVFYELIDFGHLDDFFIGQRQNCVKLWEKKFVCFLTFLITLEAVSPSGDELLPFEDGVGESVTVGHTRLVAPGDGNLYEKI